MKTIRVLLPIILMIAMFQPSCSKDDDSNDNTNNNTPLAALTQEEQEDLIYMREEEKLARDVYLYAFNLHGINIFNNISNSEQTHMDKILELLVAYNVEDPASDKQGVFNNVELQALYNDLIAKCDVSLLDALIVGATIEDVDIFDLQNAIKRTSKTDILTVYDNLSCGSRNHMRAFSGQIDSKGGNYTAQYITEQEYLEILSTEQEKCGV